MKALTISLACLTFCFSNPLHAENSKSLSGLNSNQIEHLTGAKGQADPMENVFKVSVPRDDLVVVIAGVKMVPAMGMTSWAAFKPVGKQVMVMGDMVLTEDQVNPVMSVALDNGLAVTALHNHFFWESPRLMFMHIEGVGKEADLAKAVGKIFAEIKTTSTAKDIMPKADIDPAHTNLDPQKIDQILEVKGTFAKGVYKATLGRTTKMEGHSIGNTMGINTWAAFVGSDDQAAVDGDFAMHESEVQSVLKALRKGNINVVSIHQHMIGENPRIIFLHYWGIGSTEHLAKALKTALNATSKE
jgi:hypothetical protein